MGFEFVIITHVFGMQIKSLHEPMFKSLQIQLNSTHQSKLQYDPVSWTLLFRQTVPTYLTQLEWLHYGNSAQDDNYSILDELDDSYRGADHLFHFKIVWPQLAYPRNSNEWKQSVNPVDQTSAGLTCQSLGYEAVDISFDAQSWCGLQRNDGDESLLDGSIDHPYWFYAIGSTGAWNGGIPAGSGAAENVVELYVHDWLRNDNGGCYQITNEADCVQSRDGRTNEFQNEPCQWCCGDACTGIGWVCEPREWLLSRPDYVGFSRNGLGEDTCTRTRRRNRKGGRRRRRRNRKARGTRMKTNEELY